MGNMIQTERESRLHGRAVQAVKNWKFDCAASMIRSRPLTDAETHMLHWVIVRQCTFCEFETARLLKNCLEACRIALSYTKDCGQDMDANGSESFVAKMLRNAIESARDGGFQ